MDWKKLVELAAPAAAGLASHGNQAGVLRGFMAEQERIQQERQVAAQRSQQHRQQGATMSLELMGRLQQETDPLRFQQLRDTITKYADAYGIDPAEFASMPLPDGSLEQLKEVNAILDGLAKGGYNLDELVASGATVPRKDGSHPKVSELLALSNLPEANGKKITPKKPADAVSLQRADVYVNGKKTPVNFNPKTGKYTDVNTGAELTGIQPEPDKAPTVPGDYTSRHLDNLVALWKESHPGQVPSAAVNRDLSIQAKKEVGQADDRPLAPKPEGLPPATQRRVDSKARAFEGQAAVKNAQTMAEAVGFAQSLDPNTKNPADDQALIYAFAKAMDPNSVVREGEYATVQRYAQSWAQSFGFDAARIFSNTPFLTAKARSNMKATILQKFNAGKTQYDALRKSYAQQINQITGDTDGDTWLTDYSGAFPSSGAAAAGPAVGEQRTINGTLAVWDGKGWKAAR